MLNDDVSVWCEIPEHFWQDDVFFLLLPTSPFFTVESTYLAAKTCIVRACMASNASSGTSAIKNDRKFLVQNDLQNSP